ncbi:nitroreductase family protein [Mycobacterium sp. 050134]|uniref:nitroreductase family protein n=1 Tax=Mycobacterium sp. 050134 TaxID=3096111 RepID=UPI002ED8D2F5
MTATAGIPTLSAEELLTTTRCVRKRLDLDKPVPRELLVDCLRIALQAPTASNSQSWQWVFVEDDEKKNELARLYREFADPYLSNLPEPNYGDIRDAQLDAVAESARYLADHLHEVPVLMVPCLKGRPDNQTAGVTANFWGSLLPAVWNFMLALRSRGLGSAWTTFHIIWPDSERRAAEILGIPYDEYSQGGLFPIAYTKGTTFRPAKRLPAEQFLHWNTW